MRLTVRGRLTLVYGGLFLAFGVVLLGVTYLLVKQRVPGKAVFGATQAGPAVAGPQPQPDVIFQRVAEDTRDDALSALLTQGGVALLVVGAVAVVLGWLVAGRMLQPLHQITETARRIAEAPAADRGLHERIALAGPDDEIKQLADTFDLMLTRLDRSFDGQRRFIANASHELRTPLAVMRATVDVVLDNPDSKAEDLYQHTWISLARRGLLVLAYDPPGQGERSEYFDAVAGKSRIGVGTAEHTMAGLQALLTGHTMARYETWDGVRAFDYLLKPFRLEVVEKSVRRALESRRKN